MENKSRANLAKLIADVLLSNVNHWWSYYDIALAIVGGFSRLSARNREAEMRSYMNRMAEVRSELDTRGFNLMRPHEKGHRGMSALFKVATKGDGALLSLELNHQHEMIEARGAIIEIRKRNGKHQKVLPRNWTFESEVARLNSMPALPSGTLNFK